MTTMSTYNNIILIEPFYTGSHKQLIDLLHEELKILSTTSLPSSNDKPININLATMTGKKWHWRARTSALYFAQTLPRVIQTETTVIFTSSTLPLHELIALRPDLASTYKIVYFHENQLVYPVRKQQDRDFQYGYNQILTCLVADNILFNSRFNMDSFLSNIQSFFKLQPDYRPKNLAEQIQPKCSVLYYPLCLDRIDLILKAPKPNSTNNESIDNSLNNGAQVFKIAWPHRWEFDKNPELFFKACNQLIKENVTNFQIYILGEGFTDNPEVFSIENQPMLKNHLAHIGYLPSKDDYFKMLTDCDIVISTALHEFFGVAMLEAVYSGCFPICPNNLVYPEIFSSSECLFNSESDLILKLKNILSSPIESLKQKQKQLLSCMDFKNRFDWMKLKSIYMKLFLETRS